MAQSISMLTTSLSRTARLRGLAGRQAAITLVIALLGGLLVGGIELAIDWHEAKSQIEVSTQQSLDQVSSSAEEAAYQLNREQAANVVSGLLRNRNIARATLIDNFGSELATSGEETAGRSSWLEARLLDGQPERSRSLQYAVAAGGTTGTSPRADVGVLRISLDAAPISRSFLDLALTKLALRVTWALVLRFLLSLAFYRLVIRPLSLLRDDIDSIDPAAPGRSVLPVPARHQSDEFGQLVGTMNSLLHDFQRGLDARDKAEMQLAGINQSLELRVEERTHELKQTLAELELKRDAAEQAARVKAEFLATVSHELRTPMNGVLGFVDLIAMTDLTDEQTEYVSTIRSSGKLLLTIINDILDFSRLDSGRVEVLREPFDLSEAIADVRLQMSGRAAEKKLSLVFDDAGENAAMAVGDAIRIRQVLTNLIGNAIKFTATGGISIKRSTRNGRQRVDVRDSGIGIAPEHHDKLFVAFSQVDGSVTRRYGGTGLGLAISKRLVEAMGGTIGAESAAGEGSTFWFELPTAADS